MDDIWVIFLMWVISMVVIVICYLIIMTCLTDIVMRVMRLQSEYNSVNKRPHIQEEHLMTYYVNAKGWWMGNGEIHHWDDVMAGLFMPHTLITIYKVTHGNTLYTNIPKGQTISDEFGNWMLQLSEGEYEFVFTDMEGIGNIIGKIKRVIKVI